MAIRMTGMISGLDTDSIVQSLVEAQKTKNKKTTDKKTTLEWKQEKWKDLNTKLYNLYTKQLSNLRLQKNYLSKKSVVSDETKVSITASKDAPEGSHQVSVKQMASSQYVTSAKITKDGFTTKTKLSELGFTSGSSVITVKNGDKETQLSVTDSTTVNDFLTACKDAGLNASYDSSQNRFFISSTSSGAENAFSITTGTYTAEGAAAKSGIENLVNMNVSSTASAVKGYLVALQKGGDTSQTESKLVALAKDNVNADATSKATEFYSKVAYKNTTVDADTEQAIREKYADVEDPTEREEKIQAELEKKKKSLANQTLKSEEYQQKIKDAVANGLTEDVVTAELGITAEEAAAYTFEDETARGIQAQTSMEAAIAHYKSVYANGGGAVATSGASPLANLGLGEITASSKDLSAADTGSFTLIAAKNSIINYNGVDIEDSTNSVSVNGLTIDIKGVTDTPVSCSISRDTDSTYNMIKDFITEYNSILKEMNELYYADSAKDYEPLSDDEKEAMTDSEIEKWETKIKDSLLRRDNTLNSIITSMKNALQTTVTVDGKKYSLSSFGITTSSDYTEKGLLHIYGDSDDSTYADLNNKLKKALSDDPDTVMEVVSGIAKNLYSTMADKMKKTSLSSALTFYNDKDISNQITKLNKQISKEEKALTELEDKYYNQFGAMETALAKLQSQQTALSGLFGY